jgi:hypothetical protein
MSIVVEQKSIFFVVFMGGRAVNNIEIIIFKFGIFMKPAKCIFRNKFRI